MTPADEGEFELFIRVEAQGLTEIIPAGRVRVGTADAPGGVVQVSTHDHGDHGHSHGVDEAGHSHGEDDHGHSHGEDEGGHSHGEADHGHSHAEDGGHGHDHGPDAENVVAFLKEQQWKTPFATAWTAEGQLHQIVAGAGRTRSVAGAEALLTAPLDGEVAAVEWPYAGKRVDKGESVFRLAPRAGEHLSLAELEAKEAEYRADLKVAKERLKRLEALREIEGISAAEVEAARAEVTSLTAQHEAARQNLRVARGANEGDTSGHVRVMTPVSGQIAEVLVTPREVVEAGETLARVVQTDPFWVEVYLHPGKAALLDEEPHGLLLRGAGMRDPVRFAHERVRLVSRAPVVDPHTGTVTCIFEVDGPDAKLPLGAAVEADVMLATASIGIVIPTSAVVDDAGIAIVYVQVDGESFARREVRVVSREGERLLVYGLQPDERLVTLGGAAIRRASLVTSDVGHGHVH